MGVASPLYSVTRGLVGRDVTDARDRALGRDVRLFGVYLPRLSVVAVDTLLILARVAVVGIPTAVIGDPYSHRRRC